MDKEKTIINVIQFWGGFALACFSANQNSTPGALVGIGLLLASVIGQGLAEIKVAINSKAR